MRQNWIGRLCGVFISMVMGLTLTAGADEVSPEGMMIEALDVVGSVTLTRAEVLSVVWSRPGQAFRGETVNDDVKKIAKLEATESAYYNTTIKNGRIILTFVVVEHNLVRSIAFKGNKKLKDSVLSKELSFKKGDYLDVFAARAGVDTMKEKYKKKGFPWIEITLDEGAVMFGQVAYIIEEGARPKIKKVTFAGNASLSGRQLQKTIKSKKKKALFFSVYYDPEQLEADTEKLLEMYQRKSFLDADVSSSVDFNETKSEAFVTFTIKEGPAYLVGSVEYAGNESVSTELLESIAADLHLESELKLREDYFYSEAWADFDTKKIEDMLRRSGYIDAVVKEQHDRIGDKNRVNVIYRVVEGSGPYYIGDITITGNTITQDRVVRRKLDKEHFAPGEIYNAGGAIEKTLQRGAFESVTIHPKISEGSNTCDAEVEVTEGRTGMLNFGVGAGTDNVFGQISVTERNFDIAKSPDKWSDIFSGKAFRGAGQTFRLEAAPGTQTSSYLVDFTEPQLFDNGPLFNIKGLYRESRGSYNGRGFGGIDSDDDEDDEDRIRAYDEARFGAHLRIEDNFSDGWVRGIALRFEDVSVDSFPDAPADVLDVDGSNLMLGTRFFARAGNVDSAYRPTRGHRFAASYEQVAGDHTFGILNGSFNWYKTLHEDLSENKTVLETKFQAGTIVGDAPLFEKFYPSIRGFQAYGVSPRRGVKDDPVGSDWEVVGKAEVAIPLGNETFSWLFFADAGLIDDGGVRASVGTGIQIMIPQGVEPIPMRFELAVPFMKEDYDETRAFSFSMGALF